MSQNSVDFNREVVLLDGRFARLTRHIKTKDVVKWIAASGGNQLLAMTGIVSDVVEIDGQHLPLADYMEMDSMLYLPIQRMVEKYVADIGLFKNGVA